MGKHFGLVTGFVLAVLVSASQSASAGPVVVELFTSQGCSSCPPANANLATIANRPDILALSFGVTYWDQLGWKDTFAQDKFTQRQYAYARSLGHSGPFTPQIVVNGSTDGTGIKLAELDKLIAHATHLVGPTLMVNSGQVQLSAAPKTDTGADVWLVYYDPHTINVAVVTGENNGVTLPHRNVVKELIHLGVWHGVAIRLPLPPQPQGLSTAILVQRMNSGPIIAAAKG